MGASSVKTPRPRRVFHILRQNAKATTITSAQVHGCVNKRATDNPTNTVYWRDEKDLQTRRRDAKKRFASINANQFA